MAMYWHKNRLWLKKLFSAYTWDMPAEERSIYLSFDDGPIPGVTEWVLEQLAPYQAKATFFCVGDNIRKHPQVFAAVRQGGHTVGNHTYNHLNGWQTANDQYLENVFHCQQVMGEPCRLFRPPYGKITRYAARNLQQQHYQIIMWDVLSGDFDRNLAPETCLQKSIHYTQSGSIIVFHDSIKARRNLEFVLPRYLAHFAAAGYTFKSL